MRFTLASAAVADMNALKPLAVALVLFITAPWAPAQPAPSKKVTVGELKRYIHAYLDINKLEALPPQDAARFFPLMANLDGTIMGLRFADELLEPERPLLERMGHEDFQGVYRDFLAYLERRKNIKDEANGYNQFMFFLLTHYTDHPTTLKVVPLIKDDLEAIAK